jgi:hypothetical protein
MVQTFVRKLEQGSEGGRVEGSAGCNEVTNSNDEHYTLRKRLGNVSKTFITIFTFRFLFIRAPLELNAKQVHKRALYKHAFLVEDSSTIEAMETTVSDFRLRVYFAMVVAGPSNCGKSSLIAKLIEKRNTTINTKLTKIIYCYKHLPISVYKKEKTNPQFLFTSDLEEAHSNIVKNSILILDDKWMEIVKNRDIFDKIQSYFLDGSHHLGEKEEKDIFILH